MHAVALWSAVAALAAGIGPPLGGLLIMASSWRLVFLVNVPVGVVAFVLAQRVLVESRAPGRRRVPDLLGGLVFALAIASLVLGVVKGAEWGWGNGRVVGAFLVAILLGVYFTLRSQPPARAGHRPVADPHPLVRAVQRGHRGDGQRLLRLHALQRPVPDKGMALLDPHGRPGVDAWTVHRDRGRRPSKPRGRTPGTPRGRRAGRVDLGRRHGVLRDDARRGSRLPRRVAARHADPRRRSGAHVPHAEQRGRGIGAGTALRGGDVAELGRASAGRSARSGRADRDPRHPHRAAGAARVRARMAVRGWLLPRRVAGVSRPGGQALRWGRRGRASPRRRLRTPGSRGLRRGAARRRASEPRGVGRGARERGAADGRRVPAHRPGLRRALPQHARGDRGASGVRQPGSRAVAVPRGRSGRRRIRGARRAPRGRQGGTRAADHQHAHPRRRARRAGAAERLRAQRVGSRAARHRAAEDRPGELRLAASRRARARVEPHARAERPAAGQPRDPYRAPAAPGDDRPARDRPGRARARHRRRAQPSAVRVRQGRGLAPWRSTRGARRRRGARRCDREVCAAGRALRAGPRPRDHGVRLRRAAGPMGGLLHLTRRPRAGCRGRGDARPGGEEPRGRGRLDCGPARSRPGRL